MTIAFASLSSVKRHKKHSSCTSSSSTTTYDISKQEEIVIDQDEEDYYSNTTNEKNNMTFTKKLVKSFLFPWSSSSYHHHGRRSSIGAFFQSFCNQEQPLFDSRRRRSTSSFANDALFEKYRYRKQSLSNNKLDLSRKSSSAPPSSLPTQPGDDDLLIVNRPATPSTMPLPSTPPSASYYGAPGSGSNTPRVVCWQDDNVPPSILVNRQENRQHHRHRHTSSLQCTPSSMQQQNSNGPLHRRSKSTAATHHIRHYSHVSYISSSNITAHSEDLTTKEFADLAGIKILDDEEENHDDQQTHHTTQTIPWMLEENSNNNSSIIQRGPFNNDHVILDEECLSVKSSGLSIMTKPPTIWEDAFWKTNTKTTQDSIVTTATTTSTKSLSEEIEKKENVVSPSTSVSIPKHQPSLPKIAAPLPTPQRKVIRKGRFEIHVESAA